MNGPAMVDPWKAAGLFRRLDGDESAQVARELAPVTLAAGEVLFRRHDPADAAYVITSGAVEVVVVEDDHEKVLDVLGPGEPLGELQILSGGRRTAMARALAPTHLIRLPLAVFEEWAARAPGLVPEMAALIRRRLEHYRLEAVLPGLFGPLETAAMEQIEREAVWVRLDRGELLLKQGDKDRNLYILMRGRLQAEHRSDGAHHVVGQVRAGECVGEMALFTGEDRSADVRAARCSELIRLSPEAFRAVSAHHPEVIMGMTRVVIQRLRQTITRRGDGGVTNIAVLPATDGLEIGPLVLRLSETIAPLKVLRLSSRIVDSLLATPCVAQTPADTPDAARLELWLDEQEARYPYILFEPDGAPTPWSRRCVERADRILLLADAATSAARGSLEQALLAGDRTPPPTTLVLVHDDETRLPTGTARWLEAHPAEACVHLRRERDTDYARLGRILTGRATGVVLSGGGAKGFAHIGVLRALEENGVPVDLIGGTSMGSVVAAAYSMGTSPQELAAASRRLFRVHRPFREYTLPLVSLLRGKRLDRLLAEQMGTTRIEDLWIGYFCVSADLTAAEMRVHTSGSLATAVRSSIAIPGILAPVIDGDRLLVDGGVVNNLPGDVMRSVGSGTVILVDVAPKRDVEIEAGLSEIPSAWSLLLNRMRPRARRRKLPGILQIMARTTMLSSIHGVNVVKDKADYYLRPPVERFGMLEFEALDEIVDVGYRYALDAIRGWSGFGPTCATGPDGAARS